jgi:hypothetical protein
MIIKSLSRKSNSAQLLKYLFKDEDKVLYEQEHPFTIRHNLRSQNLDSWIKEFRENEGFRLHKRKDNVELYHTIISFSNKDRNLVSEKLLKDFAKQFIRLRGENSLYLGTAHVDRDHIHLHVIMSGTKYRTGESNRISRDEFRNIKLKLDSYQREKYPELIHSLPAHDKSKKVVLLRNSRMPQKEALLSSLQKAYSKSKSLDEFISILKTDGHEPYYRAGRLTGIKYQNGLKFRLSRLGYDTEKIDQLAQLQAKEQQQLSTLRELRNIRNKNRERNILER